MQSGPIIALAVVAIVLVGLYISRNPSVLRKLGRDDDDPCDGPRETFVGNEGSVARSDSQQPLRLDTQNPPGVPTNSHVTAGFQPSSGGLPFAEQQVQMNMSNPQRIASFMGVNYNPSAFAKVEPAKPQLYQSLGLRGGLLPGMQAVPTSDPLLNGVAI